MEQSSDDIWAACCSATRQALKLAGIEGDAVAGIGFDATCSLVALDSEDRPVSVSPTGNAAQNVIVWMDHRASRAYQSNPSPCVALCRGSDTPNLVWVKENLPAAWKKAAPDFLTCRATGNDTRACDRSRSGENRPVSRAQIPNLPPLACRLPCLEANHGRKLNLPTKDARRT